MPAQPLILASTSPYRKTLLERLRLPFTCVAPGTDETPIPGEQPAALSARLARAKAESVGGLHRESLVIGSDQVAVLGDKTLGKPGNHANNVRQLRDASGRRVEFLTALCLHNPATRRTQTDVIPYAVEFRSLTGPQIEAYVRAEQPYDCAGGFKAEGLGISLFARMEGADPTALVGLPLIRLVAMLAEEGVEVLGRR